MASLIRRSLVVVAALLTLATSVAAASFDFGDAPDGRPTGYGPTGRFPSLLASNGARTPDVSSAWLGPGVDVEADSRQVNRDRFDDGVSVRLAPCATSTAYVQVTVPAVPQQGTAYLNLFFDWNRSGSWGGQDACAPEWRVRNLPIDLSAQAGTTRVYAIGFRAGRQVTGVWYRAIVSVGQRVTSEAGAGAFPRGEVEDYVLPPLKLKRKRFGASCNPNPLAIEHGKAGVITVRPTPGSVPITFVGLANSTPGYRNGRHARTRSRDITAVGRNVTYTSRRIDPPTRVVREDVDVRVRFGSTGSIVIRCRVTVVHDQPQKLAQIPERCTLTGVPSEWLPQLVTATPAGGSTVSIRGRIGLQSTDWKRQCGAGDGPPHGIRIELPPGMRAGFAQVILGDPANPQAKTLSCDNSAVSSVRCLGADPFPPESFFDIFVETNVLFPPGEAFPTEIVQLHLVALGGGGTPLGGIVSARKSAH